MVREPASVFLHSPGVFSLRVSAPPLRPTPENREAVAPDPVGNRDAAAPDTAEERGPTRRRNGNTTMGLGILPKSFLPFGGP